VPTQPPYIPIPAWYTYARARKARRFTPGKTQPSRHVLRHELNSRASNATAGGAGSVAFWGIFGRAVPLLRNTRGHCCSTDRSTAQRIPPRNRRRIGCVGLRFVAGSAALFVPFHRGEGDKSQQKYNPLGTVYHAPRKAACNRGASAQLQLRRPSREVTKRYPLGKLPRCDRASRTRAERSYLLRSRAPSATIPARGRAGRPCQKRATGALVTRRSRTRAERAILVDSVPGPPVLRSRPLRAIERGLRCVDPASLRRARRPGRNPRAPGAYQPPFRGALLCAGGLFRFLLVEPNREIVGTSSYRPFFGGAFSRTCSVLSRAPVGAFSRTRRCFLAHPLETPPV